jgi:polyisoprenoid-binding protein YceI
LERDMPCLTKALAVMLVLTGPLAAQDLPPPMAGSYQIDMQHSSLHFRVSHLGFSNYTALFTEITAELAFDPDHPEAMQVTASVPVASLETHNPDKALDFNKVLTGPEFLDAGQFPEITFVSTSVKVTSEGHADVTGDFTLHGVTKPLTLSVAYNGGWGDMPMDAGARIGFSATGAFNRSEFGVGFGVPAPGTTMGVGDRVEVILEAEFIKPRG